MTRVLIADDHAIVRRGLRQILEEMDGIDGVDEAANGKEALACIRKGTYRLVLLDISMPGNTGLEVLKTIKEERPKLPVLMLSMYPEEQYAVRALKAGASGYLTKETAADAMVAAVTKILEGGIYVSDTLAERMAIDIGRPADRAPHELLSDRELQIMRMLAMGKTAKDIGGELAISIKTVSTYRSRVLSKMGFKNNADITRYAIQHHLLE
ncbi:MAG: response regulator with a DNA-binding domain [Nitrospirae bacterium]|jgi:DNA-binding NarL/FixJ family response regulator|nr:response regulator with a DNA-binding domain [Nitrospirota bacterium]MBS1242976.1 response regulator with a DNA-binding domain [Nitrospirota bacterium]